MNLDDLLGSRGSLSCWAELLGLLGCGTISPRVGESQGAQRDLRLLEECFDLIVARA